MRRIGRRALLIAMAVFLTGGTESRYGSFDDIRASVQPRVLEHIHVATDKGGLPRPDTLPAAAITNDGVYVFTRRSQEWTPFSHGTPDSPLRAGFYQELSSTWLNDTVFASENTTALPSLQEAVDQLGTGSASSVQIVGGANEISSPLEIPEFDSGVDIRPTRVETLGDSYIRQADGANIESIIRTTGSPAHIDVLIDGNRDNNDADVIGVQWKNEQGGSTVRADIFDCGIGVQIIGNTETSAFDVYVNSCGLGVEERGEGDATPDENRILLRGHGNDGPYYRKVDPKISTDLWLDVEGCPGNAVEHNATGNLIVRGIIRGAEGNGIVVNDGHVVVSSASIISCAGDGLVFDGGEGQVHSLSCNNLRRGVVIGPSTPSNRVKIAYPSIINVEDCAVDIMRGRGISIIDPQNVEAGENTGDSIRVGSAGRASAYLELDVTHTEKTIQVGEKGEVELKWVGALETDLLEEIETPVAGMWGYDAESSGLTFYDGDQWRILTGEPRENPE